MPSTNPEHYIHLITAVMIDKTRNPSEKLIAIKAILLKFYGKEK